jgi:hypothetical protein
MEISRRDRQVLGLEATAIVSSADDEEEKRPDGLESTDDTSPERRVRLGKGNPREKVTIAKDKQRRCRPDRNPIPELSQDSKVVFPPSHSGWQEDAGESSPSFSPGGFAQNETSASLSCQGKSMMGVQSIVSREVPVYIHIICTGMYHM